jgi:chromosome segregation ATPase
MQPETRSVDVNRALQLVAWLEEERRRDKDELQRLGQQVEQSLGRTREAFSRLEVAEAELRVVRAQTGRASNLEESVRQLRDAVAAAQDRQDSQERAATRSMQAQAIEVERDRRALIEIQAQVSELARENERLQSRTALVGEEVKRDAASLAPLQQGIDAVVKRLQVLDNRVDLSDEAQRHRDMRTVELTQQVERLSNEIVRVSEWQRLAEIRWTRQLAEWQQQIDSGRHQIEDGVAAVNVVAKSIPALKDEIAEIKQALADERERWLEKEKAIVQIAAQREIDRETVAQVERNMASLQMRQDQTSGRTGELTANLDRVEDLQKAAEARARTERERVESILRTIANLERRDESLESRLEAVIREVTVLRRDLTQASEDGARNAVEITRQLDLRLILLEQLQEEHKQRQITELEQQLREMQERARQAKS